MGTDIYKYRIVRPSEKIYKHLLRKEKSECSKNPKWIYLSRKYKSLQLDWRIYNNINYYEFRIWLEHIGIEPEIIPVATWDFRSIFEDLNLPYDKYRHYLSGSFIGESKEGTLFLFLDSNTDINSVWTEVWELKDKDNSNLPERIAINTHSKEMDKYLFYEDIETIFVEEISYQRRGYRKYEEGKVFITPYNLHYFKEELIEEDTPAYQWNLNTDEFIYISW